MNPDKYTKKRKQMLGDLFGLLKQRKQIQNKIRRLDQEMKAWDRVLLFEDG